MGKSSGKEVAHETAHSTVEVNYFISKLEECNETIRTKSFNIEIGSRKVPAFKFI